MLQILALAASFNMACAGTEHSSISGDEVPYEVSYRIDLDSGQWCENRCEARYPIKRVDGGTIVLRDGPAPSSTSEKRRRIHTGQRQTVTIDRATGAHRDEHLNPVPVVVIRFTRTGQCRETEFTGFAEAPAVPGGVDQASRPDA